MALANDLASVSRPNTIRGEIPPFVWSGSGDASRVGRWQFADIGVAPSLLGAEQVQWRRATLDARAALEQAAVAAAEAAERAMSVAVVLDEALAVLTETASVAARASGVEHPRAENVLSPREREVMSLIAEGQSNKAIATALFVSPNTIKTHVASILHKMGVESRVQLAAIAARNDRGGPLPQFDLHGGGMARVAGD